MKTCLLLLLFFCGVYWSPAASADTGMTIQGTLQLWTRHCDNQLRCQLPVAMAKPISVNGHLAKPISGELTMFERVIIHENFQIRLQIFWRRQGDQAHEHYLTAQIRLVDLGTNTIVAECSHYDRDEYQQYFPVGSCSGSLRGIGIGITQKAVFEPSRSDKNLP